jgi:hypothetical protein
MLAMDLAIMHGPEHSLVAEPDNEAAPVAKIARNALTSHQG